MFRSILATSLLASAYATPAMRGLANVATTVTICNGIPTNDLLSVNITDADSKVISVDSIAFRACKTSGSLMVDDAAGPLGDSLSYVVLRNGTRVSGITSNRVYFTTAADQNIAVIAPTATTEGSSSYSPELATGIGQPVADGYVAVTSSYCIGMSAEYNIKIAGRDIDSGKVNYADNTLPATASYSTDGMPGGITADYTYTPSDGVQAYTAKMTGGQQHGKLGWITCTGIKGNSGAYAPMVSVFGTAPAGTGAAAGLAAAVSGWVALAAAAMFAGRRL